MYHTYIDPYIHSESILKMPPYNYMITCIYIYIYIHICIARGSLLCIENC